MKKEKKKTSRVFLPPYANEQTAAKNSDLALPFAHFLHPEFFNSGYTRLSDNPSLPLLTGKIINQQK
ncbi:MAG: hypothetical protein MI784_10380 [Cytophagales bacterium]|nr:hypothetical protein [Cytophagales bacterium]